MKRTKWIFLVFLLITVLLLTLFLHVQKKTSSESIPHEQGTIAVYFCPEDACEEQLLQKINKSAETIHCAFYDLDLSEVIAALQEKEKQGLDIKVVVDADNAEETAYLQFVKQDTRTAYMHDKFCVFDNTEIMTGSMNPT